VPKLSARQQVRLQPEESLVSVLSCPSCVEAFWACLRFVASLAAAAFSAATDSKYHIADRTRTA